MVARSLPFDFHSFDIFFLDVRIETLAGEVFKLYDICNVLKMVVAILQTVVWLQILGGVIFKLADIELYIIIFHRTVRSCWRGNQTIGYVGGYRAAMMPSSKLMFG